MNSEDLPAITNDFLFHLLSLEVVGVFSFEVLELRQACDSKMKVRMLKSSGTKGKVRKG